jgi:hypothetical protein
LGPLLALILATGVGFGIWKSNAQKNEATAIESREAYTQAVNMISGSESVPFLTDARVTDVLLKNGIRLSVQKSGSREIAQRTDLKQFDAAFPGGVPAAEKIKSITGAKQMVSTFYTPMVIASWKQLLPILEANELVKQRNGHWFISDMNKAIQLGSSSSTTQRQSR